MDYLQHARSKSHILRVKNTKQTNLKNINNKLKQIEMGEQQSTPAWRDETLNVLIPMAGGQEVDFNKQDIHFLNHLLK